MNQDDKQEDDDNTNTAQDRLRAANALRQQMRELRQLYDAHAEGALAESEDTESDHGRPALTKKDVEDVVMDVLAKYRRPRPPEPPPGPQVTVASRMKSYMPMPPDAATTLERQLASCAVLIENISDWVMRDTSPNAECLQYMKRISNMVLSSATAGQTAGRLRGLPWESRHVTITKHERQGEGV